MLKDVDETDDAAASLVPGIRVVLIEATGRPITLEEANALRLLLTGSASHPLPQEWISQSFIRNENPELSYGIVQTKGGPCGVLACVQAQMLKCLMFGSSLTPHISLASPLRPSSSEWNWAFAVAVTEILWRISQEGRVLLALPVSFPHHTETVHHGRVSLDGVTGSFSIHEFTDISSLLDAITRHFKSFTADTSPGVVLLLYSAILTRTVERIQQEIDSTSSHLINAHGYASQEVVNLLLTGQATTNTFDGDHVIEDGGNSGRLSSMLDSESNGDPDKRIVFRGIHQRSETGLLSLFEHYGSCKVGDNMKSPQYPIWVICSESHYTVLFGRDLSTTSNHPTKSQFDLYYYDGLAQQEDEIRLSIDLDGDQHDVPTVPPLELCIRTKWPTAVVHWNGVDPVL